MKNITDSIQNISQQVNSTARLWFDTSRENIEQTLALSAKAFDVRNPEQGRKFVEEALAVGKDNIERVVLAGQKTFTQASELAREETENAQKRVGQMGEGMSLPSMEAMFDPKTYGFGAKTGQGKAKR